MNKIISGVDYENGHVAGVTISGIVDVGEDEPVTAFFRRVMYGRWVHTDLAAHWHGKDECSECAYHEHDRRDLSHFNYCPNCGAKMDLEE